MGLTFLRAFVFFFYGLDVFSGIKWNGIYFKKLNRGLFHGGFPRSEPFGITLLSKKIFREIRDIKPISWVDEPILAQCAGVQ